MCYLIVVGGLWVGVVLSEFSCVDVCGFHKKNNTNGECWILEISKCHTGIPVNSWFYISDRTT